MAVQLPVIPEYIRTLVPYVPGKPIEETRREYGLRRIVKLASNENPLGPSPKALRAVQKALRESHRYPDASAFELKEALSKKLSVSPAQLCIGNGSNEMIELLIRAFCRPGEAIATHQAAFVAYRVSAQAQGAETVEVPLDADLRFDLGELLDRVRRDDRVRLVFLANPNNPTGAYIPEKEMRDFLRGLKTVRGGSVLAVLDYAYWEYVRADDLPDPSALLDDFENVVVLRTFSKVYGLAALRAGYAVGPAEVTAVLERIRMPFNVNSLALAAARAALEDRAFVDRSCRLNIRGLNYWEKNLGRIGVGAWPSQGNFLLVDVQKACGRSGREIFEQALQRGVIFRPVANYGLPGALRISVGTMEENAVAFRVLQDLVAPKASLEASSRKRQAQR